MMKTKLLLVLFFIVSAFSLSAQVQIIPQPQSASFSGGSIAGKDFRMQQNDFALNSFENNLLKTILPVANNSNAPGIIIRNILSLKGEEAYNINITKNTIEIITGSKRGLRYAFNTLQQLVSENNNGEKVLPVGNISDYPSVKYRGVVEGFYGEPWSFENRISLLNFMGSIKSNTYIYGPKDDPYHSSPHWRDPYPADKAEEIKKLVNTANENNVNFVWAIHPGKDIQWNHTDSMNVLKKFDMMYQLGVKAFALFFDDISGDGTNAQKQSDLLNFLHKEFVEKKGDVLPLILCPTEYNKSWANKERGTYLDILGGRLHPSIHVMWTGDRVVEDIDMNTLNWINERIKRPAYIWWNFPVSDYVRDHLLLGPVYGNALDIEEHLSGFVSNPMERAEASKTAIYGVGMYTWNMKAYDSAKAFNQAMQLIMPEAPEAYKLFSENNSDLGPNGHLYRRTESVAMRPKVELLTTQIKNNNVASALLSEVKNYYQDISKAPAEIMDKSANKELIKEIKPWLEQFALLGKAGHSALDLYSGFASLQNKDRWNKAVKAIDLFGQINHIHKTENQNPYQPGVKTGSLVLTPFARLVAEENQNSLIKHITGKQTSAIQKANNEKAFTNISSIQNQPLRITEKAIAFSPKLEVIALQPNEYIGLQWLDNLKAQSLGFNFDVENIGDWGVFEYSENGTNWTAIPFTGKNKSGELKLDDKTAYYVRFSNASSGSQNIYLKNFSVKIKEAAQSGNIKLTEDYDLATYVLLMPGQQITIPVNDTRKNKNLVLLTDNNSGQLSIRNARGKSIVNTTDNYIIIPKNKIKRQRSISVLNNTQREIKLYEIIPTDLY